MHDSIVEITNERKLMGLRVMLLRRDVKKIGSRKVDFGLNESFATYDRCVLRRCCLDRS